MATPPIVPLTLPLPALPRKPLDPKEPVDKDVRRWAEDFSRAMSRHWVQIAKDVAHPIPGVHAPTHKPQTGSDPLLTGTPAGGYATAAAVGSGDALLRSDAVFTYPSALMKVGGTKLLTFTEDASYGALLTAGATISPATIALMAPGGTAPLVVDALGHMGLGGTSATDLMRHTGQTITDNSTTIFGWNLVNFKQQGTGGGGVGIAAINISGLNFTPGSATSNIFLGIDLSMTVGSANVQGAVNAMRFGITTYTGATASRGNIIYLQSRAPAVIGAGNTIPIYSILDMVAPTVVTSAGGITLGALIRQATAMPTNITTRRAVQVANSIETTANEFITSGAGKGVVLKDGVDGTFYRLSVQNGILMVSSVGATAPAG